LLNAKNLHHSKYHSLGLSIRRVCPGDEDSITSCASPSVELVQSVTLVFAPALGSENTSKAKHSWSIRTLFGIGVLSVCPLADSSLVLIQDTTERQLSADPQPHGQKKTQCGQYLTFDVSRMVSEQKNNIRLSYLRGDVQRKEFLGGCSWSKKKS